MEVWFIIPLGGILTVLGILLVTVLYGVWVTVSENADALINFANKHTDIFLIIFAVVALLVIILVAFIYADGKKNLLPKTIPIGFCYGLPAFLCLSIMYEITIHWINGFMGALAEVFIVALALLPVFFFIWLIFLVIILLPLLLFFPAAGAVGKNGFMAKGYPYVAGAITSAVYILYIVFQSDLWSFFVNSI